MSSATAPTATPRRDLSTDFSAAAREAQQQQQQHTKTTSSLFGFFSPMFSLLLGKQQGQGAQGVTVKDSEEMIRDETEEDEEQEEEDSAATVDFVDELVASGNIDPDETLSHQEPTPAGTSGGGVTSVTSAEPASEVATGIYSVGCGGAAAAVAAAAAEEEGEEELAGAEEEEEEDWESGSGDCADEEDDDNNPYAFIRRLPYLPRGRVCLTRAIASKNPSSPRPTLVLDLDETLVHCSTEPISGVDLVFPVVWNGVEYRVYARKRPGLDAFMQQVSAWFEVVVFTASQQVYADKLLNILDPNFAWFKHRVFRDACVCVEGNYLKDLSVLGRDLATTVIIDNSPQAFGYQYNNGIPILSWFDAQDDTELIKLLPFLKSLAVADDVRPMIRSRYKLYKRIERH
jgi:CTD small phosphatase-like protein 2